MDFKISENWQSSCPGLNVLTHTGRVTHMCVGELTTIGSDNGLLPGRRQAIIWTNTEILLIGPWGTNFSEILIEILTFSFKEMCSKVSSAKWRPFCLGLNVLSHIKGQKSSHGDLPTDTVHPEDCHGHSHCPNPGPSTSCIIHFVTGFMRYTHNITDLYKLHLIGHFSNKNT